MQLQALVAQVVHRRRRAASRQKASLLRALREQSDKALAALEAESARASESLQLDAQRQVEDVCGRLEAAYADLVRTRDEYRARAAQLWSRCEALQAKAAAVKEVRGWNDGGVVATCVPLHRGSPETVATLASRNRR